MCELIETYIVKFVNNVTNVFQVEKVTDMQWIGRSDDLAAIAVHDVLTVDMEIEADLGNSPVVCCFVLCIKRGKLRSFA